MRYTATSRTWAFPARWWRRAWSLAGPAIASRPVGALRCFRGIDTRTAFGLFTELHSIEHFDRPRRLMAFVGMVPSEASSGERQRRGGITKAGNGHARKLLIEAAWHARHKPAIPLALRQPFLPT
jgi:transposase